MAFTIEYDETRTMPGFPPLILRSFFRSATITSTAFESRAGL
jgi:hypothetical protein